MKICVLGLDCAAPEIIFSEPRLTHIRRLMERGVWGRLQSVIPPITVPAWMCMATSRDPGSLGVYGFRNRSDYSYGGFSFVNSRSIRHPAIWDYLAQQRGDRSVLVGIPPGYPPRRNHGLSIGCFLTPDATVDTFTHPESFKQKIWDLVGDYPVDVKGFRTDDKEWLRREIWEMSRKQWKVVQWLLEQQEWEYFQFVDIGLDRVHHGFWDCFDKDHIKYRPGNAFENVVTDYYCWLDEQIGSVLQGLDRDTVLLVVSDHGARRLEGGFCVNEWLIREGLLALEEFPGEVTPFDRLRIDWGRTRVWSEGGYYARVFFNVQGREPQGVIPPSNYEGFRDEIKARLEALVDDAGNPLGSLVFKPEEIYREVRNVAPDLLVHFGALAWRSIGSVGHGRLHVRENDTGPDACNHSQFGMFILAAPNCPLRGEYQGARLLDMAPTLLDLAGLAIPEWMQGRSLLAPAGALQ
ncbi:MAG: alkaline phosphatase family protein [Acidobacteria bacterium]|nr:alkaline phosphatase family protein [Acidobacteriota bacterium]